MAPLVCSVVGALLSNADDASEVVEEAFWQAWRQASRYDPSRGGVSTWLGMIARSRALDRLRARRRIREDSWETLPAPTSRELDIVPHTESPLHRAVHAERRDLVAAALRELPDEQRRTIELAYFEGMSQSEIANHTGQPLGTVKTRVRLAMQKLRERLATLREDIG